MKVLQAIFFVLLLAVTAHSQTLHLPQRPADAMSGSDFAKSITPLDAREREQKIYDQIALGNVPDFLRKLSPVRVQGVWEGKTNSATYYVTPDYLAVGSDDDYFLTPLSPIMAQKVADLLHCSLPTRKMVDDIYAAAALKLAPSPIPPSAAMSTVPVFIQHNNFVVSKQRKESLTKYPLGVLVAGHKKDVVISNRLLAIPGKVAIYGWHQLNGKAIQPLYTGHADTYADYSHGVRLVQLSMGVNGVPETIPQVLADPSLCSLLSDEGYVTMAKYPADFHVSPAKPSDHALRDNSSSAAQTNQFNAPKADWDRPSKSLVSPMPPPPIKTVKLADFQPGAFSERTISYTIEPDVKVHINAPATLETKKKLKLIFYTLPNGNTTEQTIGRRLEASGDNWHFNIQHIGAQTRFLRNVLSNDCNIVVIYLEAAQKSWPSWRTNHADLPGFIPDIVDSIKPIFAGFDTRVTLSGHSGGGSFIFGYLNGVARIPDDVERIAFLDSNYAYDSSKGHTQKLLQWLKTSDQHYLSVLAYNDAVALLNGKTFVSAEGGTWGRSHAMLKDMAELNFIEDSKADPQVFTALNGRVKFLLKENSDKKIFHTVQVEKNGFIQSILSGTRYEGVGYVYFGDATYGKWIQGK